MRILLDTHILLWALSKPQQLKQTTFQQLKDPGNDIAFSAVCIWEIAVKATAKRSDFRCKPGLILEAALATGFRELPVHATAAMKVTDLPLHHRDPFDRLLVAQAIAEGRLLYTADARLAVYSELVVQV